MSRASSPARTRILSSYNWFSLDCLRHAENSTLPPSSPSVVPDQPPGQLPFQFFYPPLHQLPRINLRVSFHLNLSTNSTCPTAGSFFPSTITSYIVHHLALILQTKRCGVITTDKTASGAFRQPQRQQKAAAELYIPSKAESRDHSPLNNPLRNHPEHSSRLHIEGIRGGSTVSITPPPPVS